MRTRLRAIALGLGLLVPMAGCGGRTVVEKPVEASTAPKAVPVTVAPVERRAVERTIDVVGTLKGWEDVTIGSKKVGRVVRVHHDMGDRVKPGELLVELETTDADLAIAQAERQMEVELAKLGLGKMPEGEFDVSAVPTVVQAKVALERARNTLNRERSLARRNAGTPESLQNAETDEKAAEAALANAVLASRANLANAQAARVFFALARQGRTDLEIRAPTPSKAPPGVTEAVSYAVARRAVGEGQMVKEGEEVVELVIENPLRLWANVPERYSAEVRIDQPVRVTVAAYPGATFEGKVARINPAIEPTSRTFQVEVAIPNNRGMLRPGGFAKASIVIDRSASATVVPIESVVKFAGVTKLFLVEGDKVRSLSVETGLEGEGWVEVVGKLPEKAQVVTTGQTQLADGTSIVVRTPPGSRANGDTGR